MKREQKIAEVRAAYEAARDAFREYVKASAKVQRCRRADSKAAANAEYEKADALRRETAKIRDHVTNLYGIEITKAAVDEARAAEVRS